MFWDSLDDVFSTVTDVAVKIAPAVLPAAAAFGATKLLGGTSKEAWISAGVAGATSGLMSASRGGSTSTKGALGKAGVADGPISGTAAGQVGAAPAAGGAAQPVVASSAVSPEKSGGGGIFDSLGIQGSDVLKLGGHVLSSLDDTDDEFKRRALELRERRQTVNPVAWNPTTPAQAAVINRPRNPNDRRVI